MKLHALTTVDHIVFCKLYLIYILIHNLNLQAAELCKLYVSIFKRMRYLEQEIKGAREEIHFLKAGNNSSKIMGQDIQTL